MSRPGVTFVGVSILSLISAQAALGQPPLHKLNGTTICVSVGGGVCVTCTGTPVPIGNGRLDATEDQCPSSPTTTLPQSQSSAVTPKSGGKHREKKSNQKTRPSPTETPTPKS
jgi:hypothetical protein